jgi:hypothetical protein
MAANPATMKRLKAAAARAGARAVAAKEQVRAAKALLKQARKLFKVEKKAAKQARRKMDIAAATAVRVRVVKPVPKPAIVRKPATAAKPAGVRKPTGVPKPATVPKPAGVRKPSAAPKPARRAARRVPKRRARQSPATMRSAAEVAKSVIERLHSPPPMLPLRPIVPVPADQDQPATATILREQNGDQNAQE